MILLAILLYCNFFRILYHVIVKMKDDSALWRLAWLLLSILSLAAASQLSIAGFDLTVLSHNYKWYFRIYFFVTITAFYLGGWLQSKKITDVAKQKKVRSHLFKGFIALLVYLAFEFNLISF